MAEMLGPLELELGGDFVFVLLGWSSLQRGGVVGVEETDVLFLKSVFSLQARSLEWTYQAGAYV